MRILSLCSGIGGLELGLHQAMPESRVVAWVERDPFCQSILRARMRDGWFQEAPIYGDLADFPAAAWAGRVDLISAGIPCQPWSLAGQRRGTADERWIWPAVADLVRVVGPRYLFVENVAGFVLGGIGAVLGDLAEGGWSAEWDCFRASDVGAPHRRERWFLLADARCTEWGTDSLARSGPGEGENGQRKASSWLAESGDPMADAQRLHRPGWGGNGNLAGAAGGAQGETHERQRRGNAADDCELALADPIGGRAQRSARPWPERSQRTVSDGSGARSRFPPGPADADAWRTILTERPDLAPALATQSAFRDVASRAPDRLGRAGASRTNQLKALGNCVVPSQAALAFSILWERLHAT